MSTIGAHPLIHLGPDSHDFSFFLSRAPAARIESKRGSWQCESNLFSICCQDAVFPSEMKSDSRMWVQWTALLSGSNNYNERNGNYSVFPFGEWGSDHAENGEIKGVKETIVNIDFRKNRVSLSGDQSVSALRAWRISQWKRPMKSQTHSGTHHRSPQSSTEPVSSVGVFFSTHWELQNFEFACYNTKPNVCDIMLNVLCWNMTFYPSTLCTEKITTSITF